MNIGMHSSVRGEGAEKVIPTQVEVVFRIVSA